MKTNNIISLLIQQNLDNLTDKGLDGCQPINNYELPRVPFNTMLNGFVNTEKNIIRGILFNRVE